MAAVSPAGFGFVCNDGGSQPASSIPRLFEQYGLGGDARVVLSVVG